MSSRFASLQKFIDRPWYPLLLGVVALVDVLIIVIPVDGLTVAAILALPRRWLSLALAVALGNTLGCLVLAAGVHTHLAWILEKFGPWMGTEAWRSVVQFFEGMGAWAIVAGAISPIPLQIWVIVPALAGMAIVKLGAAILVGRVLRSLLLGWVASHAPRLLRRSRAVMKELEETR